jgi:glycosyltransferase involved in cell wall biosynthesis
MKKTFVTIFDRAKNVHLIKDVGQIPYHMYKECGYESTLVTCKNDDYFFLNNEVRGLNIKFIPKIKLFKINFGVLFFIIKNAKKIDILHLFHIRDYTFLYAYVYKLFNKKGINYIKADADEKYLINRGQILKKKHIKFINDFIDYISFETLNVVELVKEQNPLLADKFFRVSNGVDEKYITEKLNIKNNTFDEKENIIVYVARIGTFQKNTELFLNALEKIDLGDWKVHIIGEIEESFNSFIENFFKRNEKLKSRVVFHGNISSRKDIYSFYSKSKILCLSSRYEGFPLVYPEVIYFGNYILTTDVSGANDITNNGKYGIIVKDLTVESYSKSLETLIYSNNFDSKLSNEIKLFAKSNFTWQSIVQNLNKKIGTLHD